MPRQMSGPVPPSTDCVVCVHAPHSWAATPVHPRSGLCGFWADCRTFGARHVEKNSRPFERLRASVRFATSILPSDKTLAAEARSVLFGAILAAGKPVAHDCDSKLEWRVCHVFVHNGRKALLKVQRSENAKRDTVVGVGFKSSLACQAILGSEDVHPGIIGLRFETLEAI
jgi:ferredoxin, 2Fe-2S